MRHAVGPRTVDLLVTADKMDRLRPDCAPRRSCRQVTAERSTLAFALDRSAGAALDLTYRMPAGAPDGLVAITVNDLSIGTLPSSREWTSGRVLLPRSATVSGVNWIGLRWPVPVVDVDRWCAADAATLSRGGFPTVVPVFSEVFHAVLCRTDA